MIPVIVHKSIIRDKKKQLCFMLARQILETWLIYSYHNYISENLLKNIQRHT